MSMTHAGTRSNRFVPQDGTFSGPPLLYAENVAKRGEQNERERAAGFYTSRRQEVVKPQWQRGVSVTFVSAALNDPFVGNHWHPLSYASEKYAIPGNCLLKIDSQQP